MFEVLASPIADHVMARSREVLGELVSEIIGISEIPAPSFAEDKRGLHVAERMRAIGLADVQIDQVGNVCGRIRGDSPAGRPGTLLCAHIDTVFPADTDVRVRAEGDILRGPGVGDNAASVGTMLWAARLLLETGYRPRGDVIFAATVGEEGLGNLRGILALMDRLQGRVDHVLAIDGTLGGLVRQGVGSRRFRLVVESEGGHSWGAFGVPSAIHSLCRMVARIADLPVPQHPKTTYNVGLIEGGTAVNAIAARASALLDLRSVDAGELARLENRVRDLIMQIAHQTAVKARMELVGDRPAGAIPDDHPLCTAIRAVHDRVGIITRTYPSSTDGNVPLSLGIPAVTIGVTLAGNGHRLDEYIQVPPLVKGLAQVALAIMAVQQLDPL